MWVMSALMSYGMLTVSAHNLGALDSAILVAHHADVDTIPRLAALHTGHVDIGHRDHLVATRDGIDGSGAATLSIHAGQGHLLCVARCRGAVNVLGHQVVGVGGSGNQVVDHILGLACCNAGDGQCGVVTRLSGVERGRAGIDVDQRHVGRVVAAGRVDGDLVAGAGCHGPTVGLALAERVTHGRGLGRLDGDVARAIRVARGGHLHGERGVAVAAGYGVGDGAIGRRRAPPPRRTVLGVDSAIAALDVRATPWRLQRDALVAAGVLAAVQAGEQGRFGLLGIFGLAGLRHQVDIERVA